jgi:hypothetical protein
MLVLYLSTHVSQGLLLDFTKDRFGWFKFNISYSMITHETQTITMFAKLRSNVFIDALTLELIAPIQSSLKAILRDELGYECSRLETNIPQGDKTVTWKGLNDLPYGVYTLELSQGEDEMKMRLIKRV